MSMSVEITIYVIAIMIVCGMGFIVQSMLRLHKSLDDKIIKVKNQLMTLLLTSDAGKKVPGPRQLEGEIDLIHPKTGEKLKAKAKFKIKK